MKQIFRNFELDLLECRPNGSHIRTNTLGIFQFSAIFEYSVFLAGHEANANVMVKSVVAAMRPPIVYSMRYAFNFVI